MYPATFTIPPCCDIFLLIYIQLKLNRSYINIQKAFVLYISSLTPETTGELDWIFATLAQQQTQGMLLQSLR